MASNLITLAHDSFARQSLIRQLIPAQDRQQCCAWCGAPRAKYHYGTQSDGYGARPQLLARPFCSISCFRSFR